MLAANVRARVGRFDIACDLEVASGKTVALVGASGAGKTTLLRAIAGLVRAREGSITCDGDCWFDSERRIFLAPQARSCGMVFAEYALFEHMSALENVSFGLRALGTDGARARARGLELMETFGVAALAGRRAGSLSSGEMQRVAIARALAPSPRVLLLDEPFSAVDVERRAPIRALLLRYIADSQTATVIVTHDPIEALLFARDLIVLEGGTVVQRGKAPELRERPRSSYVAAFAGVNLYEGVAQPQAGGVSDVAVDGATLTVIGRWEGRVALVVEPDAVVLSKERPDSSARNCLSGRVAHAYPDGNAVRVTIVSTPPIVARISQKSAVDLDIKSGDAVYAYFKAGEVRVH
ncbi:MAG TPA: ABC transporter ATP-binding protein [Candidatus Acidoferrales bacterium]|nr:ABC transporter ATP-binding protein [Candidatus Acidoferrales bacterium]